MRRNRLGLLCLVAIALSGCGEKSQPESVYVDLDRILTEAPKLSPNNVPSPRITVAGSTVTLPAEGAMSLRDESKVQIDRAREKISADRRKEFRALTRRLEQDATDRVHREEADRMKVVEDRKKEIDADTSAKFRAELASYASKRGPLVANIALWNSPQPDYKGANRADRLAKLQKGRSDLALIDADHKTKVDAIRNERRKLVDAEITKVKTRTSELEAEAIAKAQEEARQQIRQANQSIDLNTLDSMDRVLPALPPKTSSLPTLRAPTTAPTPVFANPLSSREDRLRLLKTRLDIWAKATGVRISSDRSAKDGTEAFRQWMNTQHFGL